MEKKGKNILSYLFWAAVAVVLLYFCLRSINWAQFTAALEQCQWEYVLLAMLLGALVFFIRGLRWRMLLKPLDPSISILTCFNAYNICMAANLAIPRAGEVVRVGYVVKNSSIGFDKALGTLLAERAWDILTSSALIVVLVVAKWQNLGALLGDTLPQMGFGQGFWWAMGVLVLLIAAFLLLCWKLRERGGIWGKVWGIFAGIGSGLGSFRHMQHGWLFLLYTAFLWIIYWIMSACILWALQGIDSFAAMGFSDAFYIMVIGTFSSIIPVPGGFGAYHGLVAGSLISMWGVQVNSAMVYATLNHESQVVVQAVCGLASYLHESFFRRKK